MHDAMDGVKIVDILLQTLRNINHTLIMIIVPASSYFKHLLSYYHIHPLPWI